MMATNWVSPTGASGSGWTDTAKAYDDNTATDAYVKISGPAWSNYIELTHAALDCSVLRFWAWSTVGDNTIQIDLDVYYASAWHDVYEGAFSHLAWVEKELGDTYTVTKARVRFYWNQAGDLEYARLYEFDFGKPPYVRSLTTAIGLSATFETEFILPKVCDGLRAERIRVFWDFQAKTVKAKIEVGRKAGDRIEYVDAGQDDVIDVVEPEKFIDGTNSSVFLKVSMEGPKTAAASEIILVDTSWQLWGLDVEIEGRFDD